MLILSAYIIIVAYLFVNGIISISTNQTKPVDQLSAAINYGENDTFILLFNTTTNYSYFITFRSFGNKQFKFGLFSSVNKFQENSIEIFYQYHTNDSFYLFIVCFHFIVNFTDLDVQCKDIRLINNNQIESNRSKVSPPSYNPLFIPVMYALCVIMVLPIIIRNHYRKRTQVLERRKQLRRFSTTIAQGNKNPQRNLAKKVLSHLEEDGDINYKDIPIDIELSPITSTKTILGDMNDNKRLTSGLETLQSYTYIYDNNDISEQPNVNAHACVAHLLDKRPWNISNSDEPLSTRPLRNSVVHDCAVAKTEASLPERNLLDEDSDNVQKFSFKTYEKTPANLRIVNKICLELDK